MKKQIENYDDVQLLVRTFYDKVLKDDILSPYFSYVKNTHWEEHLEVVNSFWNNILFYTGGYHGNPLAVHSTLNFFSKLERRDFDRWLQLFTETVDDLFDGEKADLAKQRARSIATIMQVKILNGNNGLTIGSNIDRENNPPV